jgi:hypothetical protein
MPAFAYSAYTLPLVLASHPEVDGWDVDVIAEDHHMFCKCYFAALWEAAHASQPANGSHNGKKLTVVPQVKIHPVFLPAVCYLVESSEGSGVRRYVASCWERFKQARRHSQGVVELGYVLLQYVRLMKLTGVLALPSQTHLSILAIAGKMHTLHITSTAQCFALIMAVATTIVPTTFRWVMAGGLQALWASHGADTSTQLLNGWGALNLAQQALASSLSSISGVVVIYSVTCFVVVKDLFEGRYYANVNFLRDDEVWSQSDRMSRVDESEDETQRTDGDRNENRKMPAFVQGPMSLWQSSSLFWQIFSDTAFVGYTAITFFAMIPVCLAGWSLFRRGTEFEYIVALKPE